MTTPLSSPIALFFLVVAVVLLGLDQARSNDDTRRRSLEIELEQIQDSSGYEVEVLRLLPDGKTSTPQKFNLKTTVWKASLTPGHYQMKVRSLDSRGVPGDWNSPKEFMVKLFSPNLLLPADLAVIKSEDETNESVKFEWEAGEKATEYKLEVRDQKNKLVFEKLLTQTTETASLQVGSDYSWQVTPASRGTQTEGETSPPHRFKLLAKKLDTPQILKINDLETRLLSWKAVNFAQNYEVQLEKKSEETWSDYKKWAISQTALKFSKPLPSGRYRLSILAKSYDRVDSDLGSVEFETLNALGLDLQRASYQSLKRFFCQLGLGWGTFQLQK